MIAPPATFSIDVIVTFPGGSLSEPYAWWDSSEHPNQQYQDIKYFFHN